MLQGLTTRVAVELCRAPDASVLVCTNSLRCHGTAVRTGRQTAEPRAAPLHSPPLPSPPSPQKAPTRRFGRSLPGQF